MATVAVDVDDTLYSFGNLAREVICEEAARTGDEQLMHAAYAQWSEWRTPADQLKERWLDIIGKCHKPEIIMAQQPYAGTYDVLWRIIEAGHDITYISTRNPATHGTTELWLNAHGFPSPTSWENDPCAGVKLICTMDDKAKYIRDCQYMIDDRPKTIVNFVYDYDWKNKYGSINKDKQRKGFALHTEYNCGLTDVPGIYLAKTWALLDKFLVDKGVAAPSMGVAV